MNWRSPKILAAGLRDQAPADCIAARFALRPAMFTLFGCQTTLAHVVTAKCQQSVEKMTKGYLLWHLGSFDPTKGHNPFTQALGLEEKQRAVLEALCMRLNKLNTRVVAAVKWLESLAPHPPEVPANRRGSLQPLENIPENSEYPFWSASESRLVTPAEGLSMHNQGVRAIKAVKTFFTALAQSDPRAFTKPIEEFLETHRFSTVISEWPAPEEGR